MAKREPIVALPVPGWWSFSGCIGHIDGTLCKIRRPHRDPLHSRWFNGRKKCTVSTTLFVDHDGLFIYIDSGFPGSFHDITILRHWSLHANWRDYFEHEDDYFQYVLGYSRYIGEDMFLLRRDAARKIHQIESRDHFNCVHAGRRVRVEWGIGGLKRKWKRVMKRFDNTKPNFTIMLRAGCLLTKFIHRRQPDMALPAIDADDDDDGGWKGDF